MNFEEYAAKPILAAAGIAVPRSQLVATSLDAGLAADKIGPCVVKAQVPTGKRGNGGLGMSCKAVGFWTAAAGVGVTIEVAIGCKCGSHGQAV